MFLPVVIKAKSKMAERGGFEPPVPVAQYDGLANRCLRPLSHLSASKNAHRNRKNIGANMRQTCLNIQYFTLGLQDEFSGRAIQLF